MIASHGVAQGLCGVFLFFDPWAYYKLESVSKFILTFSTLSTKMLTPHSDKVKVTSLFSTLTLQINKSNI